MKIGIKYKLTSHKKGIVTILITSILFFQIFTIYMINIFSKNNEINEYKSVEENSEKDLNEIIHKINEENFKFLNIEKIDGSYNVQILISGEKEDISQRLKSINYDKILDYEFSVDCNYIEGKVTLSY